MNAYTQPGQISESMRALTRRDQVFPFLKPDNHPLIDTRHNILLYVEGVNKSFGRTTKWTSL